MTIQELMIACGSGGMPQVKLTGNHKFVKKGSLGFVTTIKQNGRFSGCAVRFDKGPDYDCWFHEAPGETDKRTNYMHQIELVETEIKK